MQYSIDKLLLLILLVAVFFGGWQLRGAFFTDKSPIVIEDVWDSDPAVTSSIGEVVFNPESFRTDVEELVSERNYAGAIAMLMLASATELSQVQSEVSYCAIDKCSGIIDPESEVSLPGTSETFELGRDWLLPDSGRSSASRLWDDYSRFFAERYNRMATKTKEGQAKNKNKARSTVD